MSDLAPVFRPLRKFYVFLQIQIGAFQEIAPLKNSFVITLVTIADKVDTWYPYVCLPMKMGRPEKNLFQDDP
ncbi:hypothetical protein ASG81_17310 [Paenibacillus sp. Soil522]|nr:hypothetical protein ASG81_17310 [Paenibacillus sp. Soil522]